MFLYLYVFILCVCIGSFANVMIYRLPINQDIVLKRSYCPHCHHKLGVLDLVPIVSYLALKGKCRYCKCKISFSYPLVELISGLFGIYCFYIYGLNIEMVLNFFVIEVLFVISMIDIKEMIIPDECNFILFILALLNIFIFDLNLYHHVFASFVIPLFLLLMNLIVKDSFGGGDIKLMFSMGLYLGVLPTLLSFVIALLLAGSVAIYLLLFKRVNKKSYLAFGPFLSMGILFSLTYGNRIIDWYLNLLK